MSSNVGGRPEGKQNLGWCSVGTVVLGASMVGGAMGDGDGGGGRGRGGD